MSSSSLRLEFGGLDLNQDPGGAYWFQALGDGASLGNPQPVVETLPSQLLDGSFVQHVRDENREPSFQVQVCAADSLGLAQGERALFLECGKRSQLLWQPPGGIGKPTVYEVLTSSLEHSFDDMSELRLIRTYRLILVCEPFGHSVNPVTVTSTSAASPTRTTLLDGSTTTGWSAVGGGALSSVSFVGRTTIKDTTSGSWAALAGSWVHQSQVRATLASLSSFASVDVFSAGPGSADFQAYNGSTPLAPAMTQVQADGFVRYFYDTSAMSSLTLDMVMVHKFSGPSAPAATPVWYVDDLAKSTGLPSVGTGKQSLRSLPIRGSVRAPATLHVSGSTALVNTLVVTSPDLATGFTPNLRAQFRVAGGTVTADSAMISGSREVLTSSVGTSFQAAMPYRAYPPGTYMILARFQVTTGQTTITAGVYPGATPSGNPLQTCSTLVPIAGYAILPVGLLRLPPRLPAPGASGLFSLSLTAATGGAVTLDDVWTVPVKNSAVTIANNADKHLWLQAPTVDFPRGALWSGSLADQSDAFSGLTADVKSQQPHMVYPGQTLAFVATSGATTPTLEATYFPACLQNSAD